MCMHFSELRSAPRGLDIRHGQGARGRPRLSASRPRKRSQALRGIARTWHSPKDLHVILSCLTTVFWQQ